MYYHSKIVQELRGNYGPAFSLLDAVNQLGETFIDAARGQRNDTPAKQVLAILFTQAFNTLRAATLLLEAGYGVEATMLHRPIVENFVNCCYIANSADPTPDTLAERYLAYQDVVDYERYRKARDEDGLSAEEEQRYQQLKEARDAFDDKYWRNGPFKVKYDWAGMSLRDKAQQARIQRPDAGTPHGNDVEVIYQVLYPYLSGVLHGGPNVLARLNEETDEVDVHEHEPSFLPVGIRLAVPALTVLPTHIVTIVAGIFGLQNVVAQAARVQEQNRAEMRKLNAEQR